MTEIFWQELTYGLPDTTQLIHVTVRLIAAALLTAWPSVWEVSN